MLGSLIVDGILPSLMARLSCFAAPDAFAIFAHADFLEFLVGDAFGLDAFDLGGHRLLDLRGIDARPDVAR